MHSNQKRVWPGNKQNMHSHKDFTVGTSMKDFKSHVQVVLARVH
jgi:hypothetical protein